MNRDSSFGAVIQRLKSNNIKLVLPGIESDIQAVSYFGTIASPKGGKRSVSLDERAVYVIHKEYNKATVSQTFLPFFSEYSVTRAVSTEATVNY